MLISEGFTSAKYLFKKFVSFNMFKRITIQIKTLWLRTKGILSALRQAGGIKRANLDILEDLLLMRGLRDFNRPKIVPDDKLILLRLISDLIPKIIADLKIRCRFLKRS